MSKKASGIEAVAEAAAHAAYSRVMSDHIYLNDCESPIESILYAALKYVFETKKWFIALNDFYEEEIELVFNTQEFECYAWVCSQCQIEAYRVDFVVRIYKDKDHYYDLVVECDGHDFHERTKDQAKRDRSRDRDLQRLGYRVYRFTGSEIWADPIKCAEQVWAWARETDK